MIQPSIVASLMNCAGHTCEHNSSFDTRWSRCSTDSGAHETLWAAGGSPDLPGTAYRAVYRGDNRRRCSAWDHSPRNASPAGCAICGIKKYRGHRRPVVYQKRRAGYIAGKWQLLAGQRSGMPYPSLVCLVRGGQWPSSITACTSAGRCRHGRIDVEAAVSAGKPANRLDDSYPLTGTLYILYERSRHEAGRRPEMAKNTSE